MKSNESYQYHINHNQSYEKMYGQSLIY